MLNARRLGLGDPAAAQPKPRRRMAATLKLRLAPASGLDQPGGSSPHAASGRLDAHARLDEHALGDLREFSLKLTDLVGEHSCSHARPGARSSAQISERSRQTAEEHFDGGPGLSGSGWWEEV